MYTKMGIQQKYPDFFLQKTYMNLIFNRLNFPLTRQKKEIFHVFFAIA
jgi:hypothetical protein